MTAKEKAIREAYGSKYEYLSEFIDSDGWCKAFFNLSHSSDDVKSDFSKWRPKILSGLENNRGWTRIESYNQFECIPNGTYEWFNINNGRHEIGDLYEYGIFTHYKQITLSKQPLY